MHDNMDDVNNMAGSFKEFTKNGKKILGAAFNYHRALQAAKAPKPENPVIFMKSSTSYITEGNKIKTPQGAEILEEVELGVVIGKKCKDVEELDAMLYVGGYCLALDLGLNNLLPEYRKKGFPWCISKSFDTSCPVSRFVDLEELKDPHNVELWCKINGKLQQTDNTSDLVFNIPQLISYCSKYMTLEPGDLILTGTGPNCGIIKPGDTISCGMGEVVCMEFDVE
ncbi:oxaloacetate tautomerase FAHD1, mitochondrial [Onthophagus taurus]|uniref:oxaloacetate tautomerase FAHD1, mitochondrial n=1 Tax=Onthophagus taurus TaxID=166361 RepID=UPI000C1FE5FF|nr:acylpyruvase FAHD1, mitochondrial [Onthophagus taurus]